jgi:hypothetical protein
MPEKAKPGRRAMPTGHRLTLGNAELRAIFATGVAVISASPDLIRRLGIESVERSALRVLVEKIEDSGLAAALR